MQTTTDWRDYRIEWAKHPHEGSGYNHDDYASVLIPAARTQAPRIPRARTYNAWPLVIGLALSVVCLRGVVAIVYDVWRLVW